MANELKPCPFCGGKAKLSTGRAAEDAEFAQVQCKGCGVQTDYFEDAYAPRDEAAAAWNRRAEKAEPFGWVRRSEQDGYPPAYHFTTEAKTAAKWQRAGESPRALYDHPAAAKGDA